MNKFNAFITLALFLIFTQELLIAQNALHFDGIDDVIQTTSPGVLGDSNRTFEAWINVDTAAPVANLTILDYGTNAVGSRNTFLVDGSGGLRYLSGGTNANISSTPNVITRGQWTHVAFVLNNGTGFLYVDRVQVGSGSLTTVNTPTGNASITIGQRVTGGNIPFSGIIDEVRIWNIALDTMQLNANMNTEFCTLPNGLISYYTLNEGTASGNNLSSTTAIDQVASNNGTLNGFALTGTTSNWVLGAASISSGKSFDTVAITNCQPITSPSGLYIYSTSGSYIDTIPNSINCDSIITTNFTRLNNTTYTNLTISSCGAYSSPSGNIIFNTSGTYLDTIITFQGCDSIFAINLTVTNITTAITISGNVLTAAETGARYRWLDCNNGFAALPNDTNRILSATANGLYAVEITKNGCIDTSSCVPVVGVGIEELDFKNLISISNNPTNDYFWLTNNSQMEITSTLYNLNGQVLTTTPNSLNDITKFDLSDLPKGIYLLNVISETGSITNFKVIRN